MSREGSRESGSDSSVTDGSSHAVSTSGRPGCAHKTTKSVCRAQGHRPRRAASPPVWPRRWARPPATGTPTSATPRRSCPAGRPSPRPGSRSHRTPTPMSTSACSRMNRCPCPEYARVPPEEAVAELGDVAREVVLAEVGVVVRRDERRGGCVAGQRGDRCHDRGARRGAPAHSLARSTRRLALHGRVPVTRHVDDDARVPAPDIPPRAQAARTPTTRRRSGSSGPRLVTTFSWTRIAAYPSK